MSSGSLQDRLLLDNPEGQEQNALLQEFMKLYSGGDGTQLPAAAQEQQQAGNYKTVDPTPEFCIKSKSSDGKTKIFLNMCSAEHLPSPKDITDQELVSLLESEDPSRFRVPMSLGEPHAEVDKSGNGCTVYDIVISKSFCDKISKNDLFMGFFMSVVMEGLENKYEVTLNREWVKLRNKKCMGKVLTQHIRTESKPWIMEMDPSTYPARPDAGRCVSE